MSKSVFQFTKAEEFIREWGSVSDIKRELFPLVSSVSTLLSSRFLIAVGEGENLF